MKDTNMMVRKPKWLRMDLHGGEAFKDVEKLLDELDLNTVCKEANCPNKMECFNKRTATFMILGRNCTRNCTFCNVTKAFPTPVDINEPIKVARAVKALGLKHAVITSVTRDDLSDGGANHFAKCVEEIRKLSPETTIELLIPDLRGDFEALKIVTDSKPDILNHNVETVPELYDTVRPMADFKLSVELLKKVKEYDPNIKTKSGVMLGLGETKEQILRVFEALRVVDCDILTVGQYLQPSIEHINVVEYIEPAVFDEYAEIAEKMGFSGVSSGPLVRSSYHAEEHA